jgi:hypothetical protein
MAELVEKITLDVLVDSGIKATGFKVFKGWAPPGTAPDYLNIWPGDIDNPLNLPLEITIIQFSAFSLSMSKAMNVRRLIKEKYEAYNGIINNSKIINAIVEGEPSVQYEEDTKLYHAALLIKFIVEV